MALECFSWITQLLCHRYDDEVLLCIRGLPDCLIIEILTRLPADCLVRMPTTLISSRYFSTLHLRRARPLLIMHNDYDACNVQKLFVFDESVSKEEEKMFTKVRLRRGLMINKVRKDEAHLRYSCEGVLLFTIGYSRPTYLLFNPITQEEVLIPREFDPGNLCTFYYCSLTRQFKLLYVQCGKSQCQYSIYSVRTQTWRRKIHCPTPNLLPGYNKPAVVNGAVHLLVGCDLEKPDIPPCPEGIMVLNMDKEEFSNMPHPGSCSSWKIHKTMSLLVKDECLCLCQVFIFENRLDIWILEDYEARIWTKKCEVELVFNDCYVRSRVDRWNYPYWHVVQYVTAVIIKPLHFLDGELVFCWSGKGLFMYNMNHNTLRNVEGPEGLTAYTLCTYKKSLLTIA